MENERMPVDMFVLLLFWSVSPAILQSIYPDNTSTFFIFDLILSVVVLTFIYLFLQIAAEPYEGAGAAGTAVKDFCPYALIFLVTCLISIWGGFVKNQIPTLNLDPSNFSFAAIAQWIKNFLCK